MPFTDIAVALQIALTYFTIIYLTGLGGLFSERSGIVNIGLEGMMIIGTVTGAWGARYFTDTAGLGLPWGPILGLLVGAVAGLLFAGVHAIATISFKVDHIVSGVVINLVAIGLARFLSEVFFGQATQSDPGGPHLTTINIPLLSSLPWGLGRAFEGLSPVVVFAFLMVFPVSYALYRTRWGLRLRSCGENPEAARSLGVRVSAYRYQGVLLSGAFAGLSGAFLASELIGNWHEGTDARTRVHLARRAHPVELEPEAADVLRLVVRVRAGDPAPVERRPGAQAPAAAVHQHDPLRGDDRGDRGVRGQGPPAGGGREGVRGRHDVGLVGPGQSVTD